MRIKGKDPVVAVSFISLKGTRQKHQVDHMLSN